MGKHLRTTFANLPIIAEWLYIKSANKYTSFAKYGFGFSA